ncbi:C-C motif chemokine 18-like [Hoplias malabaricus]|uniref:C-C motif chemokine 18-like n=1 Tax=Hoplias malabaricus TaxID=27720 RepID=UPI003461B52F
MKAHCFTAIAVFLFAYCSLTLCQNGHMPRKCCFKENYITSPIPHHAILRYETTTASCTDSGVILHTVKQKQVCANPSVKWVKRLMRIVENRTAAGSGDGVAP